MAQKPVRDWVYLVIISLQLVGMLVLDFTAFYPKSLYEPPSAPLHFLIIIRDQYLANSGDPFFGGTFEGHWFHGFLYIELLFQFPLAVYLVSQLASKKPSSGPTELAGLAFGCLTAMGSVACACELWQMGPELVKEEHKASLFYGTYLPFVVIPAVLAVDMYARLLPRVRANDAQSKTL
ncbi:hypothetical protein FZEAL_8350 [Fusarium zealandicum]|uniref:Efficient mitochondria targeting-associated protein 19 n=1 Tax=Fusarium zealandicum TaxID=1053134 RepID=A0A8H4UE67_9HYPO|nr:hypothetical protein FZEAL_8350 [Fusarium zealandicum]